MVAGRLRHLAKDEPRREPLELPLDPAPVLAEQALGRAVGRARRDDDLDAPVGVDDDARAPDAPGDADDGLHVRGR